MKYLCTLAALVGALTLSSCVEEFYAPPPCHFFAETHSLTHEEVLIAARQGDGDAQYALGYMYWYGYGVARDPCAAKYWIDQAVKKGHREAVKAEHILNFVERQRECCRLAQERPVVVAQAPVYVVPYAAPTRSFTSAERYLLKRPNHHYTLHLLSTTDERHARHFIKANGLSEKAIIYYTHKQGEHYNVVIYGDYRSADEARAAIGTLPHNVQKMHPRLQQIHDIKHAINRPYRPRKFNQTTLTLRQKFAQKTESASAPAQVKPQLELPSPKKFSGLVSEPKLAKKELAKTTVALNQ